MRDCDNVTMRERLPDLMHGRLTAADQAAVESHVASCADCRAELDLLRAVVRASVAPHVDPTRIASRLPAYRRPTLLARAARAPAFQVAAAVVLLAGGAAIVSDRRGDAPDTVVAAAIAPGELAVGALSDIADGDLEALLEELSSLAPVPSAEPDIMVVPAVRGGGE